MDIAASHRLALTGTPIQVRRGGMCGWRWSLPLLPFRTMFSTFGRCSSSLCRDTWENIANFNRREWPCLANSIILSPCGVGMRHSLLTLPFLSGLPGTQHCHSHSKSQDDDATEAIVTAAFHAMEVLHRQVRMAEGAATPFPCVQAPLFPWPFRFCHSF